MKIGPVEFTLQSVFVSVVSTAIVFPISFIVVTIFRKTRPKPNKLQQSNQVQSSNKYGWKTLSGQLTFHFPSSIVQFSEGKAGR